MDGDLDSEEEGGAMEQGSEDAEMRAAVIASALLTAQNHHHFVTERGRALIFSSGWENVHFVDSVTSGVRFVLPVFFGMGPPVQPTRGDSRGSVPCARADSEPDADDAVVGSRLPSVEEVCAMWASE